mgnify:CR=1 FL=1
MLEMAIVALGSALLVAMAAAPAIVAGAELLGRLTRVGEQWSVTDVAKHLGVARNTVTGYRARGQMPVEDGVVGTTPWWHPETITRWQANRPGRGRRTPRQEESTAP